MPARLSIGDFSRMTHLSVKALRHYHEHGLLEPVDVDPVTGYRSYDVSQLPTAQVIRRFRDLDMPLDHVRRVLQAPDVATRNRLITEHLTRMEAALAETHVAVASLRALLEAESRPSRVTISYRLDPALRAAAVMETVTIDRLGQWFADGFEEIYAAIAAAGGRAAGPGGGLYAGELFTDETGEATLFVPIDDGLTSDRVATGRVRVTEIPASEVAVAVHEGSDHEADRTYAALGAHVAEHSLGVAGPIREHYLVGARDTPHEREHRTEICWPVFHITPATAP